MIDMPQIGYGTWTLKGQEAIDCTLMALELGYRHIDTARMYQNESEVGKALAMSGLDRDEVYVTTKIWPADYPPARFRQAAQESCAALQLEQPDLLLLHWPPEHTSVSEALDLLGEAQDKGWARHIGVSNFNPDLLELACQHLPGRIACNQVEFHPYLDQRALQAKADELKVPLVAYCPVARGKVLKEPQILEIAKAHGRSPTAVVLKWILDQGLVVIPKSANKERAADNLACESINLSEEDNQVLSQFATNDGSVL